MSEQKYKPGDFVRINEPSDPDHGKVLKVLGLSPSTQHRRSAGSKQWRYHLSNRGYYNENHLEPA